MNKLIASLIIALFSVASPLAFAGQDPAYPFTVKIAGAKAEIKNPANPFAVIDQAVSNNAEIEVEAQGQVIINLVQCDDNGNPIPGKAMAVIMFEAPKGKLDKTLNGQKLESGKYLANVVAGGTTSRIVFNVK